jgi:TRAP-type transport system periplasmic protein
MMRGRHTRKVFLTLAAATIAVPPSAKIALGAEPYTLRLGITTGQTGEYYAIATQFAGEVARKSNGRLKIDVYPNAQLAVQRDFVAAMQNGLADIGILPSVLFSSLFPQIQVLDLPFMFRDIAGVYRVLDGPFGSDIFTALESKGIVGLAWGEDGFREVETANKAIRVPSDLKGVRLRIQESPISVATMQALGVVPVAIDVSETLVAIQQKVVDGLELGLNTLVSSKFDTVIKYVAMTSHGVTVAMLLGSKQKLDALPADLQKILKDEGKACRSYWEKILGQRTVASVQALKSKGLLLTEVNHAEFRRAVEPVYVSLQAKLGKDLINRVSRTAIG